MKHRIIKTDIDARPKTDTSRTYTIIVGHTNVTVKANSKKEALHPSKGVLV